MRIQYVFKGSSSLTRCQQNLAPLPRHEMHAGQRCACSPSASYATHLTPCSVTELLELQYCKQITTMRTLQIAPKSLTGPEHPQALHCLQPLQSATWSVRNPGSTPTPIMYFVHAQKCTHTHIYIYIYTYVYIYIYIYIHNHTLLQPCSVELLARQRVVATL